VKHNIILDVDTGIDDAMAIMFAVRHPDVVVKAITCVGGNAAVGQVVDNTLRVLDLVGAPGDIPVAAGAAVPLIEPARDAGAFHGKNGLADLVLPEPIRAAAGTHAVDLLRRVLLAAEQPLTLVTLAPLTNIALLLRTHPEVSEHIERIVMMGGSASGGNATPVAEFNVWHDPEAAYIVLNSGLPLTIYGLDVFERIAADEPTIEKLKASADPVESVLGGFLGHPIIDPTTGARTPYRRIGDAGAVCSLVAPDLFSFETWPAQVDLSPGLGRGQTLVDRRSIVGEDAFHDPGRTKWPVVDIALGVDPDAVLSLFFETTIG
jgi:pyrimidine-specific ribonucleoside hydrolase